MKKVILLLMSLAITPVMADQTGLFLGVKTGSLEIDVSGFDADTPVGLVFGYHSGGFGAEVEVTEADIDLLGINIDYSTFAVYGTYRSTGDTYFKAKAGLIHQQAKASGVVANDGDFSWAIGAGHNFGTVSIEAEYTTFDSETQFISVGANFNF